MALRLVHDECSEVLVVSPLETTRRLLKEALYRVDRSIVVTEFAKPSEAELYCVARPIELLVLEYARYDASPGRPDAIEFAQWFRGEVEDTARRTYSSRHSQPNHRALRRRAIATGITDFLASPIDPLEAQLRCTNLLRLHRLERGQAAAR